MMLAVLSPSNQTRFSILDVDVIVNGDLLPLWNIILGTMSGAVDRRLLLREPRMNSRRNIQSDRPGDTSHSGVMLLNLDEFRSKRSFSKQSTFWRTE